MLERMSAIFICMALVAVAAPAQQSFVVPLSDPGKPATLEASIMMGSISVVGYEGSEVQVEVTFETEEEDEGGEERAGLKRIPSYSAGVTIEEKNNKVEISTDWTSEEVFLKVKVPRRTSLRLQAVNGDLLEVEGVTGTHELEHTNGEIKATGLRGSVLAGTTNGDVWVELLEADADTPMSFSSFNGDVTVIMPATIKADLYMQSGHGDIYTDFDIQLKPTEPKVTREQEGRGYRVRMEKAVEGTIGGGGPELRFKTFNGDIILRRPE